MKPGGWHSLLDKACLDAIREAGGCLVAVSGGADSTALLCALVHWTQECEVAVCLEVLHVNHLLRGDEARRDAVAVEQLCGRLNLPYHLAETNRPDTRPPGTTLEEYLRNERHRLFDEYLIRQNLTVVAVGHNADDQIETFLMQLMRGTGLRGLTFRPIEHRRDGLQLVRPLWKQSRRTLLLFLKDHQIAHHEDSSNTSMEFTRNRVRAELLPFMEDRFNPRVREALLSSAEILSGAQAVIMQTVTDALAAILCPSPNGNTLRREVLLSHGSYLQAEIISEWIRNETNAGMRISSEQTRQILNVAAIGRGRVDLSNFYSVTATRKRLMLLELHQLSGPSAAPVSRNAELKRLMAEQELRENPNVPLADLKEPVALHGESSSLVTATVPLLNGTAIQVTIQAPAPAVSLVGWGIRNRTQGDRVSKSRNLKTLLIDEKVPAHVRDYLIFIVGPQNQLYGLLGLPEVNLRISGGLDNAAVKWSVVPPSA